MDLYKLGTTTWQDSQLRDGVQVKIAEGVYVIQKTVRVPGGLSWASGVNNQGRQEDVHLPCTMPSGPAPRG